MFSADIQIVAQLTGEAELLHVLDLGECGLCDAVRYAISAVDTDPLPWTNIVHRAHSRLTLQDRKPTGSARLPGYKYF